MRRLPFSFLQERTFGFSARQKTQFLRAKSAPFVESDGLGGEK